MVMVAPIAMAVIVIAVIVMAVIVGPVIVVSRDHFDLADTGALSLAERAAFRQPLHVVMVALLGPAHVLFKAEDLSPVFAKRTIHRGVAAQHLLNPFSEGVDHLRVIAQIPR